MRACDPERRPRARSRRSPGAFAEYVRVDGRETFALPESIAPALGALVEPLAVGLHAVRRSLSKAGDRVLVLGAGPVGLAVTTWLSQFGVRELVVSDPSVERRTAAEQFGATRIVDPTTETLEPRYDLVFECVGLPGMTDVCTAAAVRHGKVVIAGVCAGPDPYRPVTPVMKELSIDFVVYYTRREFSSVIDALARTARSTRPRSSPRRSVLRAPTTRSTSSRAAKESARSWCSPSSV